MNNLLAVNFGSEQKVSERHCVNKFMLINANIFVRLFVATAMSNSGESTAPADQQ
jgi:hypothetical protein